MNYKQACEEAAKVAQENRTAIAVVNDPIANAEDEGGPWGYCPVDAVPVLFRFGKVEHVVAWAGRG